MSTFGTHIPSINLKFYFSPNNDLISWVNKSSRAGALVLGVINTFSEFFAFYLINGKNWLIKSLAFCFSYNGTLSSISGTNKVAPDWTHFFSILSWFPGTYRQEVIIF